MLIRTTRIRRVTLAAGALGACLFATGVMAAGSQTDIEARYQSDVARCKAGQTNQDQATCLQEAGAAREEARRNRLSNGDSASTLKKNATDRCNALPADKRADCLLQMSSPDTVKQGSAQSGGVLRETVIPIPATPPTPATPATPMTPMTPLTPATPGTSVTPAQ